MTSENGLWLLDILIGVLITGLAWWNTTMWNELKALSRKLDERDTEMRNRLHAQAGEINKLNVLVVGGYVTREELRDSMREMTTAVTGRIDRLSDKMDGQLGDIYDELKHKVDKP
jgi:hypothetical protein